MRDVALVGAGLRLAIGRVLVAVGRNRTLATQRVVVPRKRLGHGPIGDVILVAGRLCHFEPGARGERPCLEAVGDLLVQGVEPGDRVGAHSEVAGGILVDNVGCVAAVGDVALDNLTGDCLLPQHGEVIVALNQGVEGIHSEPWVCCSMCRDTKVLNPEAGNGCGSQTRRGRRDARVRDETQVDIVVLVGAGIKKLNLAATV